MKQYVPFQYLPLNAEFTTPGMEGVWVKTSQTAAISRIYTCAFHDDELVEVDIAPISACKEPPPAEPDPMQFFHDGELDRSALERARYYHVFDMADWWAGAGRKFLEIEFAWKEREKQLAAA